MLKTVNRKFTSSSWRLFWGWLVVVSILVGLVVFFRLGNRLGNLWQLLHQEKGSFISLNNQGVVVFPLREEERGVIFYFPPQTRWYSYYSHRYFSLQELLQQQPAGVGEVIKTNLAIPLSGVYLSRKKDNCPLLSSRCLKDTFLPHPLGFKRSNWQEWMYWYRLKDKKFKVVEVPLEKGNSVSFSQWDELWQRYTPTSTSFRVALFYRFQNKILKRYYRRLVKNLGWQVTQEESYTPSATEEDYNEGGLNYCFGPVVDKVKSEMPLEAIFNCLVNKKVKVKNFRSDMGIIIQSLNF